MVDGSEKKALPVNYRRAVNSQVWPKVAFLCLKLGCQPNELIDLLVVEEYLRRKNNDKLQRYSSK